jgi:hypothetical protein
MPLGELPRVEMRTGRAIPGALWLCEMARLWKNASPSSRLLRCRNILLPSFIDGKKDHVCRGSCRFASRPY